MEAALLSGAFVGLIYGLFAVGLVVVYRGSKVINFAHGETGMVGTFVFVELWSDHGCSRWVAAAAGVAVSAAIAAVIYLVIVNRLRDQPLNVMIATFGAAGILLVWAGRRYSLNPRFVEPVVTGDGWRVAGFTVQPVQLAMVVVTVGLLALLWVVYQRTSLGLRLRATAADHFAAAHLGVNVRAVSLATWSFSGAVAAVVGILIAPVVTFNVFFMTALALRGLTAALLGGLTRPGAVVGAGVAIGMTEGALTFRTNIAGLPEALLVAVIVLFILVRPGRLAGAAR